MFDEIAFERIYAMSPRLSAMARDPTVPSPLSLSILESGGRPVKAITVHPDDHSLGWEDVPDLEPGPGEVLVDVAATAVNRADLLQRRGLYPPPEGASEIMGLEMAGRVAGHGSAVDQKRWPVGARVCALLAGGGYAEQVVVPEDMLLEVPEGMPLERAAAVPEVFYTAYLNLVIEAGLEDGEVALIHAGASGVGTAAIQICRQWGARALATASGAKLEGLQELGLEAGFDRHQDDMFEQIRAHLGDETGVDVVLDPVAAGYLEPNLELMATGGRLVVIGLLGGLTAGLPLARLLRNRLRIIGSVLRSRSPEEKASITARFAREVWPHVCAGRMGPVIDRVLDIGEVEQAHGLLQRNETTGKVVLRVVTSDQDGA